MKYNEKELARMSEEKPVIEGRLNYKKVNATSQYYQSVYKERWFKLIDNFLFYFRLNDIGIIYEKQAAGVFVLENVIIQPEIDQETPFSFSIFFKDEPEKKHIFSCMSEKTVGTWISKIQCASYEYLRSQLFSLQSKIYLKTGKDPLLMVPRNAGSMSWKPRDPKSGFICHLDDGFLSNNLHRSKSSVNVRESTNKLKDKSFLENSWHNYSEVERSKTSVHVFHKMNPDVTKLSSPNLHFHRSAPSPPPRRKNSPLLPRGSVKNNSHKNDNEILPNVLFHGQLMEPPLPPVRKHPTKTIDDNLKKSNGGTVNRDLSANVQQCVNKEFEGNLIDF